MLESKTPQILKLKGVNAQHLKIKVKGLESKLPF